MLVKLLSGDTPRSLPLTLLLFAIFVGLALAPFLFPGTRSVDTAARICVFILLVASYDLLLGYAGIVSFAHTMFFGVGAYGVFPVDEMERRLQDGDEIWFTTDGQMATDTPYCAIERLYPYYCWKYGVSGYEFWGVSWWTYGMQTISYTRGNGVDEVAEDILIRGGFL